VGLSIANLDLGNILSGAGQLAKDLRTAVTGKEPISADKAAEIALKVQEVEAGLEQARMGVMLAEASSQDKWTSRARPAYMYVFYLVIVVLGVVAPLLGVIVQMKVFFENVAMGFKAIPNIAWEVFCAGYLGYTGFRSLDKWKEKR
jgi:Protein of unknown function (DUF3154).